MKILIDAHMVGENEAGNETYIVGLLQGLSELAPDADFLVATAHRKAAEQKIPMGGRFHPVNVSSSSLRRLFVDLPNLARGNRADLLHITYMAPPFPGVRYVASIHDIIYTRHPEWFSRRDRCVLWAGITSSVKRAEAIITLSEHARQDIHHKFSTPLDRIHAIHLAAVAKFNTPPEPSAMAATASHLQLKQPFVLAVGSLQPRKNLKRLIEAFAKVKATDNIPHQLVLVGKAAWRESDLRETVQHLKLEQHILFTGYIPDDQLHHLYHMADVFVYPSLYEGFGLPVVEAMACGTPVITSNCTSIPEITGDAAMLIDPWSSNEIAGALSRLIGNPDVKRDLAQKGCSQARKFSWRQTAEATFAVYEKVTRV